MSYPILPKSVDVSKLKYSEVKTLASGSKSIYINYGTQKLRIQTPVMHMPYGIGEGFEDKTKPSEVKKNADKKYDVTLSFKGADENSKIQTCLEKMREIEAEIIDKAFENREPWFKDDYDGNKAFVARMFSPMVKLDKDPKTGKVVGKYPPTMRVKIPYDGVNDKFNFDSLDMENNEVVFQEIITKLKSGKCQLIIELTGIWIAGGKYGTTWKVISGKFQIAQNNKMAFIVDSDTEKAVNEDEEEDDDEEEVVAEITKDLSDVKVDNSEDEATEEPVVEDAKDEPAKTTSRGRKTATGAKK
jgi:hypothetical protein